MTLEQLSSLITNSTEIFLVGIGFLAMIFTGIQAFLLYKALVVAEKFESQHIMKLKIEEFFKHKNELYQSSESLKKSMEHILSCLVDYSEVPFKSNEQQEYWRYDEEEPCPLYYFKKEQIIFIFYKRILAKETDIRMSISTLESFLIFFDDEKLSSKFKEIKNIIIYWPHLLDVKNIMKRPLFEAISRDVNRNPDLSIIKDLTIKEADEAYNLLIHLDESNLYDKKYSINNVLIKINEFQQEIFFYLKRLNVKR